MVAAENEFRKVTGRSSGLDCGWTYDNLDDAITVIDTVLNHFNMQANVTRLKNDFGNYRGNIYIAGFIYQ